MKPFKRAVVPESELIGTAKGWMDLWKQGDPNTRKLAPIHLGANSAFKVLLEYCREMSRDTFLNDVYQVARREFIVRELGNATMVHLSIKRIDKQPCTDWRDFQQIKNELVGEECEGVELFPAESRMVDCANQYHLWVFKDQVMRYPFGFSDRMVSEKGVYKSQQRPFK